MLYSYAMLTADQLREVQKLEEELGTTLVAFQGQEMALDELTPEKLEKIKEEETKLGMSLVAVAQ